MGFGHGERWDGRVREGKIYAGEERSEGMVYME